MKEKLAIDSSVLIKVLLENKKVCFGYKLLPNDALIAAACKHYKIKKIATLDPDFKKVDSRIHAHKLSFSLSHLIMHQSLSFRAFCLSFSSLKMVT